MTTKLTAENVTRIFMDSMFTDDEVAVSQPEEGSFLKGIGVQSMIGFHSGRCNSHKQEVIEMLDYLADSFKTSGGGGMSFLNMCVDKHENQWTGMHQTVDQLICLGVALELLELTPREMNNFLPGGMPYVIYKDSQPLLPQITPDSI